MSITAILSPKVIEMDITEVQENFETLVDDVACGKYRVAICVNGRPAVDMVPVGITSPSHVTYAVKKADNPKSLWDVEAFISTMPAMPILSETASLSAAVLDERAESR